MFRYPSSFRFVRGIHQSQQSLRSISSVVPKFKNPPSSHSQKQKHQQQNHWINSKNSRFLSSAAPATQEEHSMEIRDSSATKADTSNFKPTPSRKYKFFSNVKITPEGVAIIEFDNQSKPVNTISFALKDEAKILWKEEIESNEEVKAVVFTSSKGESGFIAGADINDIRDVEDKNDLNDVIRDGMEFFQHMKNKNIPMVCAINGPALGGGLEWALWCDYRICTDSSKTKLGLPEVKLGLLPGFGGTQNLTSLVGVQNALDMMLTGKDIRPIKAKKMGLVDLVVSPHSLEKVAVDVATQLANGTLQQKSSKNKKSWMNWFIEDTSLGNKLMWDKVHKTVQKNTNGKYPAPFAIIECVKNGLKNPNGMDKYTFERENFVKLAQTSESEALIGIFNGMTSMKKHNFVKEDSNTKVQKVAVMGAGLMGAGIAQVTAEKGGYDVLIKDQNVGATARGESYILDNWKKKLSRRRMTNYQYNVNSSKLNFLTDDSPSWQKHFSQADMVVEAVFEDLDLKRKIVRNVEEVTPDHCVFATNTSAIPIADIAQGSSRPENIVGMHYFSPVPSMPLLEIIPHSGTSENTKAIAYEVGTKQGKTCLVVKDVPGFYVNRCLGPFLVEVSALIRDGVDLEILDKSMRDFGMPVGPITLADEVGIDVTSHVASFLSQADLGARMEGGEIKIMQQMIEKGWLGKKANQGFYTYNGKQKTINSEVKSYVNSYVTNKLDLSQEEIQNRMVCRMINECAKCLEDEIISDPVVGDIGMVFGTGFAPFTGGPFRYLDTYGVGKYVKMMEDFAVKYDGAQFEPCQMLKDYAMSEKKFHG